MFLPIVFYCPCVIEGRAVCFIFIKYVLKEKLSPFPLAVLVKQNNGNKDLSALESYGALSWGCKTSLLLCINLSHLRVSKINSSRCYKNEYCHLPKLQNTIIQQKHRKTRQYAFLKKMKTRIRFFSAALRRTC